MPPPARDLVSGMLDDIGELVAAAVAWNKSRIPKTSSSSLPAADRLTLAVDNLLAPGRG